VNGAAASATSAALNPRAATICATFHRTLDSWSSTWGAPVVPEVYGSTTRSSGSTSRAGNVGTRRQRVDIVPLDHRDAGSRSVGIAANQQSRRRVGEDGAHLVLVAPDGWDPDGADARPSRTS
jgi:hypothetical protein